MESTRQSDMSMEVPYLNGTAGSSGFWVVGLHGCGASCAGSTPQRVDRVEADLVLEGSSVEHAHLAGDSDGDLDPAALVE